MDLGTIIFWTVLVVIAIIVGALFASIIYFIHTYNPKSKPAAMKAEPKPVRPKPPTPALQTLKDAWANAFKTEPASVPLPVVPAPGTTKAEKRNIFTETFSTEQSKKRKLTPAELAKRKISTKPGTLK